MWVPDRTEAFILTGMGVAAGVASWAHHPVLGLMIAVSAVIFAWGFGEIDRMEEEKKN